MTQLAVWLSVQDAVGAQHLGDLGGIDRLVEVDGADDQGAGFCWGDEWLCAIASLSPGVQVGGGFGGALDHAVEATVVVHPLDLVIQHQQGAHGWGVVGLVLAGVVHGSLQIQERRDVAVARCDFLDALNSSRGERSQPQATIGSEALLWGEVVGVSLGNVDWQATSAGGRIDQHQGVTSGADNIDHRTSGGLVVSPSHNVSIRVIQLVRGWRGAWLRGNDLRLLQPRRLLGNRGELPGELAIRQVSGLLAD